MPLSVTSTCSSSLTPSAPSCGADVALDAERHIGLDHAVVAGGEILRVQDVGVFAGHADAVGEDEIAVAT